MPRLWRTFAFPVVLATSLAAIQAAPAAGFPPDPSSNFAPISCSAGTSCLTQAIQYLDEARARLGQPAYRLPGNFSQLSAAEQAFVLTNLDRTLYGLTPITGLTSDLNQVAAAALRVDSDPEPAGPGIAAFTSNWGSGYPNLPLVYGAWMFDDGPGGPNLDCSTLTKSGCWVHRHNILWRFTGGGPLALGAAAGTDAGGTPSYAMVLVQGTSAYHPSYVYTWSQAVAAGAGSTGSVQPRAPSAVGAARQALRVTRLRIRGHSVSFRVLARPGARPRCSIVRPGRRDHFRRCGPRVTYRHLGAGRYRLRVVAAGGVITRYLKFR